MAGTIPGFYLAMAADGNCAIKKGDKSKRIEGQILSAITFLKNEVPMAVWKGSEVGEFVFENATDVFEIQIITTVTQALYDQVPEINVNGVDVQQSNDNPHQFYLRIRYSLKNDLSLQKVFLTSFFDAGV